MSVGGWIAIACTASLILVAVIAGFIDGQSLLSALNQNARPFAAIAVGIVLGVCLGTLPGEARMTVLSSGVAILALAGAAIVAVLLGQPADGRVSPYFIYYDSALPAMATAVFLALVISRRDGGWRARLVMAAAALISLASFRLTVWIAAAGALGIAVVLVRNRVQTFRRLAVATLVLTAVLIVVPGLGGDVHDRVVGASSASDTLADPPDAGGSKRGGRWHRKRK